MVDVDRGFVTMLRRMRSNATVRQACAVVAVVALCVAPTVVFALLDQRPPDSEDAYFTAHIPAEVERAAATGTGLIGRARGLVGHVLAEHHQLPNLCTAPLYLAMARFEPSRSLFRLATLPFAIVSLVFMYLCGRALKGHRFGLLAAFVLGVTPAFIHYSRKWETMVHGTALSLAALYIALRILMGEDRRWAWIALGLIIGLASFAHPFALFHSVMLLASLGAITLVGAWRSGETRAWAEKCLLAFAVGGAAVLLPLLGGASSGSGRYSIWGYVASRVELVAPGLVGLTAEGGQGTWSALVDLAQTLFMQHWMPPLSVLLFLPGLLAAPFAWRSLDAGRPRRVMGFGVLLLAVHVPLAWFTQTRIGMAVDWFCLLPVTALMCLLVFERRWSRLGRPRGLFVGFVSAWIVVGAFNLTAPMAASLAGPDPFVDDSMFSGPLLRGFTRTESGHREHSCHLISHEPSVSEQVFGHLEGSGAGDDGDGAVRVGLWDLRYVLPDGSDPVGGGAVGGRQGRCEWFTSASGVTQLTVWPLYFAGFPRTDVRYQPGVASARFHVVRLHADIGVRMEEFPEREDEVLERGELEQAVAAVSRLLGVSADAVRRAEDPLGWCVLETAGSPEEFTTYYANEVLLVDRGPR